MRSSKLVAIDETNDLIYDFAMFLLRQYTKKQKHGKN